LNSKLISVFQVFPSVVHHAIAKLLQDILTLSPVLMFGHTFLLKNIIYSVDTEFIK